ncbi:hypothetical protein AVEN_69887-1 [Araneus ventricosus]|uniref:Fatty acid synthase n=1 Tax=Araneus ventricosus TaxID=182803 RepID=A0A4Y2G525_ARAVE|nr:hypothetical protein AVEN_17700-1 [Araneus ventricosus]GBM47906.1 hypothetical protein AVEN_69887-1 [Araneus ventricosus]
MSSVFFNDAVKTIPPDSIIIEIGPHFLLQTLLRRTVGPKALYFGLMKRNEENNIKFFMDTLGNCKKKQKFKELIRSKSNII